MTGLRTRERDALLTAIRRATLAMKAATAEGAFEMAMERLGRLLHERRLEQRYNPNWPSQPRVPRGNPDGGRWTDGGASGGEQLEPTEFEEAVGGDMSPWPAPTGEERPEVIPAAERPPPGPKPRLLNRHIRQEHVGRTDAELAERILARQVPGIIFSTGMDRTGSFDSIEAARDFIAQTIDNKQNGPESGDRSTARRLSQLALWLSDWPRGRYGPAHRHHLVSHDFQRRGLHRA